MQQPRKHLQDLGLTDSEVTVYLAMVGGARLARDLVKGTQLKRPTVYYALACLEKRGLIRRTGQQGEKRFALEPLETLTRFAEEKIQAAKKLQTDILEMIPGLSAETGSIDQKPTVAFYEGVPAVKHVIMDMFYCRGRQINSVVPKQNFFWDIGRDFVEQFLSERVARKIRTKNLWVEPVKKEFIKQYYEELSEIRIVPPAMKDSFHTTVFLYDDKTLYVASLKNSYAILITSQEHHDTMQAWFDGLWSVSKSHAK